MSHRPATMKPSDFFLPHPKSTSVECRPDYTLLVEFDNGERGVLDMKPYLDQGVFRELLDLSMFRTAHIAFDTVAWDNDIDLHPAWVYHKTVKTESAQTGRARDEQGAANF